MLEHRDREDMATFAHSLGVEPEDMWSGNAQFGIRDICAALMERIGSARDGAVVYTVLQGESLNEHHPAYEYYQKREHRVMDTLTRAVERDGLADPRREARTALSMMNGIRVRLAQGSGIGRFSGRLECLCRLPVASTVVRQ